MPKVSEMIQSKYLRKEDIDDEIVVTLKDVSLESMPGDVGEQRWVLAFKELPKGLVLNSTTIRVLEKAFGADSDDWVGKKAVLYVDPNVSFKGQIVGGLRLRPLKPSKPAGTTVVGGDPPAASTDFPFNDEIP